MAVFISVVKLLIAILTASMVMVAMSPPTRCTTRELLLLSPCLPFISAPPNNLSDSVPSSCCEAFSSAYGSGGGICLCYFLRDPQILGFPLNNTKLTALSSICPLSDGTHLEKNSSLDSLCSASRTLPPLQSSKIPGIQEPDSPAEENTPPPAVASPPSTLVSPPPSADELPQSPSSATAKGFSMKSGSTGAYVYRIFALLINDHFYTFPVNL
ncbi:uncharacterized protein LOC111498879 [Cucurbita maxima]|uniref:Uncharacterized protein LOC111498879 n=1 Tax=Cucurbita maxima TaxID=3661 RepID=A0A6J1KWK3_CUCMA|nr:uncharacterized protein LOC111498879 [Cucurbita maxima]